VQFCDGSGFAQLTARRLTTFTISFVTRESCMAPQQMPVSVNTSVSFAPREQGRSRGSVVGRVILIGISALALGLAVAPVVLPVIPHIGFASTGDGSLVLLGISFVSAGAVLRRRVA
jgi:hypothetical protein